MPLALSELLELPPQPPEPVAGAENTGGGNAPNTGGGSGTSTGVAEATEVVAWREMLRREGLLPAAEDDEEEADEEESSEEAEEEAVKEEAVQEGAVKEGDVNEEAVEEAVNEAVQEEAVTEGAVKEAVQEGGGDSAALGDAQPMQVDGFAPPQAAEADVPSAPELGYVALKGMNSG